MAGCKPCVRIIVSASGPPCFDWKTKPSGMSGRWMKTDRITIKKDERVEVYIRHANGEFVVMAAGPGNVSIVRRKESAK
jgi:hypothetical protein